VCDRCYNRLIGPRDLRFVLEGAWDDSDDPSGTVRNYELYIWKNGQWRWCIKVASGNAIEALRLAVQACSDADSHPIRFEEEIAPFINRKEAQN